jgi:Domain of unknown function (DUF4209)
MAESHYNVTFEEVAGFDWQKLIEESDTRDCVHYHTALYAKASEYEKVKNEVGVRVFRFLGSLASLHLNENSPDQPFEPMIRTSTGRSAVTDDYSEVDLETIKKLVPLVRDSEFRARLADVLWLRTLDNDAAETAIDAYIKSATNLEDRDMWPRFFPQVERALRLAATIGKRRKPFKEVVKFIDGLIRRSAPEDSGLLTARAMELLLEHGEGDATELIRISKELALRAEKNENWLFARTYWDLNAQWNERAKRKKDAQEARIRSAETFLSDSEAALGRDQSSYFTAAHFLSQGLEALRRAGASRERLEEIHKKLLQYNKRSTDELREYAAPEIDISALVAKASDLVKGKSLRDATLSLAIGQPTTRVKELRQQVEKNAKEFPFAHLFSAVALDDQGRVIAQKPSLLTSDPDQIEGAIRAEMFHHAHIGWQLRVQGFVNPARAQIWEEHHPSASDFKFLVVNNPFIPSGRENIFARGIQAGFSGDLLVAAHLLIPEVENSLRYVLVSNGVITSKQSPRLIQQERDLNSLLRLPEVTEIFGEDIVFDLQGIFVERFGANLRNRLAHGLLDDSSFYSVDVLYAWWLILRLLAIPVARKTPPPATEQTSAERIAGSQTVSDTFEPSDQTGVRDGEATEQASETLAPDSDV